MERIQFVNLLKLVLRFNGIAGNEYMISSGGALLMYGLRKETRDLDISVNQRVWEKLLQTPFFEVTDYGDEHPKVIHTAYFGIDVEFYADFEKVEMDYEEILGVRVLSLPGVLKEKQLRTPKTERDYDDIRNIIFYMNP